MTQSKLINSVNVRRLEQPAPGSGFKSVRLEASGITATATDTDYLFGSLVQIQVVMTAPLCSASNFVAFTVTVTVTVILFKCPKK